ncbi:hypothetical protein EDB85DRAFT_2282861 [Lactarius pseudohatsudake]|nr:hypothetical protein EDB85DRAFT_2282861 [Lactarius pseudohatsudake]
MSMPVPVAEPAVASESSHVATLSYRVVRVAVDVVLSLSSVSPLSSSLSLSSAVVDGRTSAVVEAEAGGDWRPSKLLCLACCVALLLLLLSIAVVFVVVAVRYLAVVDGRALEMAVANETGITRPGNESGTHTLCTYAANHDQDNFDNTVVTTTTTATTATMTGTTVTTNGKNGYDNGKLATTTTPRDNGSDNSDNGNNDRDNGDDKRRKQLRQRRQW